MRFCRLDLIRFGKFTDLPINLPAPNETGKPDFHLIVGVNEAGKSTIRHAIADLLFGIEPRSRFDFLHAKSEMRLGAQIENGEMNLEFHRLKRNKQPLRGIDDTPLPDDALAPFTGNADRTSFEREFCLDHTRLASGGQSILDSKDDVGRMLFEASVGDNVFGTVLDRLEKEATALWSPRHSKDRAFYKAHDAFKDATKAVKDATARTSEWKEASRKFDEASEALVEAKKNYKALEQIRTQIDRVRRIAPHFQSLKAKKDDIAKLGDIIELPENAINELNAVKNDIATADQLILRYQALIDKAIKDQDGVSLDETLLTRKDDILELRDEKSRIKNHPNDIIKREAESQALSEEIKGLVHDLELEMTDEESIDSALPSAIARKGIESLATAHGGLEQAVVSSAENMKRKDRDITNLSGELDALPTHQLPPNIESSLAKARALGNIEETKIETENRIERAREKFKIRISRMHPWMGSVKELRQLAVPSDEEVQEFKNKEHDILTKQKNIEEQHEETEDELKVLGLKESGFQKSQHPVTSEEILTSRKNRDGLWAEIRSGTTTAEDAGDNYETHVTIVDDLTDRRYQNADKAKELEHLLDDISILKQKGDGQNRKIKAIEDQHQKLMDNWNQIAKKLNLSDKSISASQTWLGHYRNALSEAEKLTDEKANLCNIESKEAAAMKSLRQELVRAGISEGTATTLTLQQLIDKTETVVAEAKTAESRSEHLENQIKQGRNELEDLENKATKSQQELDAWKSSWSEKTKSAGLPGIATPKFAIDALAMMSQLKEKLKENRDLKESRIKTMQRDISNFEHKAETLAQGIALELIGRAAEDISVALCQRLTEAENAQNILNKAKRDIEENTALRTEAQSLRSKGEEQLSPLMERAKVDTIADLETAIKLSQNLCDFNNAIEDVKAIILELGDGMSLNDLDAEVAEEDLSTIAARLNDVKDKSAAAISLRDDCVLQKKNAETERDKIHGQGDAAAAEAQRQEALAQMAEVTERYIKVHTGAQLLRWAIERYRDEKRGPLLDRASEIFSILTLRSFQTLEIDYDGDTPQLMGRRPDGKYVDFDGLSDGTGDQLFLSLRLAAVEMQLQHVQPLPFIADDLFINYSDDRAAQGFKVLGELATKSQVIYFTHHDHLVDVARRTIGKEMSVIQL